MRDDIELATIKPSEHMELIIYRLTQYAQEHLRDDITAVDINILSEMRRLHEYLKESGQ